MLDYSSPNVGLDEIVFENRNKEYGAYDLRKRDGKNSARAAILAIFLLTTGLVAPSVAKYIIPTGKVAEEVVPVVLDRLVQPPLDPNTPPPPPPPASTPPPPKAEQIRYTAFEVKPDDQIVEEPPKMDDLKNTVASNKSAEGNPDGDPREIIVDGIPGGKGEIAPEPLDEIMDVNDISEYPGFPGGDEAMIKFLQKNIIYPQAAIRAEKQGKVFLEILVEKDGTISEVKVVRGIGFGLDQEAERAVRSMPKWTPAKYNGSAVKVKMHVPISFAIGGAD